MAKEETVQIEIKNITLDIEPEGLGVVELMSLASTVEKYMLRVQKYEIDTLKQALITALHFAAKAYEQSQHEGGKRREEESRVEDIIVKLKTALDGTHK